jgi:hypothetical protein
LFQLLKNLYEVVASVRALTQVSVDVVLVKNFVVI